MSTYLFRNIIQFNIDHEFEFNTSKNSATVYGSIRPTNDTINFGNQTWSIFEATQKKVHNDVIYINDTPYENYESRNIFNIYVNSNHTLLIAVGSTKIVNSYLKKINTVCDSVEITVPTFDFDVIAHRLAHANAVWIRTDRDPNVTTEALMGPGVDADNRTTTAIDTHHASFLRVIIDIDQIARMMGFSTKGSIVLINPNQPMGTNERINLVYTTYRYVTHIP